MEPATEPLVPKKSGGCCSGGKDATTIAIDEELKQEKKIMGSKIKLLLLGSGESGKSTFTKQMMILHLNGFKDEEDRLPYKTVLFKNIFENIRTLIENAIKFEYKLKEENEKFAEELYSTEFDKLLNSAKEGGIEKFTPAIKGVWEDPVIQITYGRASEYQLNDSASYFFEELERISDSNYIPDVQDILRFRAKTSGIHEIEFSIGKTHHFRVVDVGGQRAERRKWIHCFEDVTAILFFVALSEYDQKLAEDLSTNRMHESLILFRDISNSKWFRETAMILFLNKKRFV